eukprot:5409248-Prorocentrum_lima.AAC.1
MLCGAEHVAGRNGGEGEAWWAPQCGRGCGRWLCAFGACALLHGAQGVGEAVQPVRGGHRWARLAHCS